MLKAVGNFFRRILVLIIFLAVIAVGACVAINQYINKPIGHADIEMTVEPGMSVNLIANKLESKGVIVCSPCFRAYIGARGWSAKLRAGDYKFESGLTVGQVISRLLKGDFAVYKVTIPEGWTLKQIAEYLKKLPFVANTNLSEEFSALTADTTFIKELGLSWELTNLEGYLFPSTYEVYKLRDAKKMVSLMFGEFKNKFSEKLLEESKKVDLKPEEVVILASIIEKETSKNDEKPLVSSVFHNRLKKGMLLQSDPTIIYGLKDYDGNIRKSDITNPHKYNTYVHAGLPPGPICNPGEEAINAALNPATTEHLFFVSNNDGTHIFSENYEDHQKAVYKYQIKKK